MALRFLTYFMNQIGTLFPAPNAAYTYVRGRGKWDKIAGKRKSRVATHNGDACTQVRWGTLCVRGKKERGGGGGVSLVGAKNLKGKQRKFAMRGHPIPEEELSPIDPERNNPPGRRRDLSQMGGEVSAQLLLDQVGKRESSMGREIATTKCSPGRGTAGGEAFVAERLVARRLPSSRGGKKKNKQSKKFCQF